MKRIKKWPYFDYEIGKIKVHVCDPKVPHWITKFIFNSFQKLKIYNYYNLIRVYADKDLSEAMCNPFESLNSKEAVIGFNPDNLKQTKNKMKETILHECLHFYDAINLPNLKDFSDKLDDTKDYWFFHYLWDCSIWFRVKRIISTGNWKLKKLKRIGEDRLFFQKGG